MPKNKGAGGKGFKRRANTGSTFRRNIIFKEDGQEYAQVEKMLGCGNVECRCFDNVTRLGKIRGKMLKRVWINKDDIVLVGLRDFEDDKELGHVVSAAGTINKEPDTEIGKEEL